MAKLTKQEQYRIGKEYHEMTLVTPANKERGKWRKENYPDLKPHQLTEWAQLCRFGTFEECLEFGFTNVINRNKQKAKKAKQPSGLYIMRFDSDDETFFKIGITEDLGSRLSTMNSEADYDISVLHFYLPKVVRSKDIERVLHQKFANYSYKPRQSFGGETECFSVNPLDYPTLEFIAITDSSF